MDPLEEFISREALRLLLDSDDFATTIDQPSVSAYDQSLSLTTLATATDNPSPKESKPTRKRVASDANIPGCSTLVLDKAGSARPKRAKFSAEGRAKVASVRKKGACMRCHRDKISCSGEWPCESCCRSRAVVAGRASRHRWMDCVPFSMKDLDIFASEMVQKDHLMDGLLNRVFESYHVDFSDIWLGEGEFHLTMKSDPSLGCLNIGSSRISSGPSLRNRWISRCKDPVSDHVDGRLDKSFQILAVTWLIRQLVTKNKFPGNDVDVFQYAQSVAGSKLLQGLEKTLSSSSLSKLGAETLRALMRILLFTVSVITWSRPRFQSSPEFDDRQQQLVRVLAHHIYYIGERLHCFEDIDKEVFFRNIGSRVTFSTPLPQKSELERYGGNNSSHTMHTPFSSPGRHGKADNSLDQRSMFAVIPLALDGGKGEISQPTLHNEADIVYEPKNGWGAVQRHATAKSPCLADPQPEDRHWTFSDHNKVDPPISAPSAAPLPVLQPDTVCSWCGCLQISYKPSHGVLSCDRCFSPYQPNDATAWGWNLGEYQSTNRYPNSASGLDNSQGELMNYASRPEITTSGTHGHDLDDFSWFMAS